MKTVAMPKETVLRIKRVYFDEISYFIQGLFKSSNYGNNAAGYDSN